MNAKSTKPPKIVITGASGLLGRALMARFSTINPIGYAFTRAEKLALKKVDLTNQQQMRYALEQDSPDIIIHAAAERRPNICTDNQEQALELNVQATENIARYAKESGAWLLYLSTDYVFDGTQPPYAPNSTVNPINFYGKSKLSGELVIKETLDQYGILRVGMLYGKTEHLAESAVTTLIPLLDAKEGQADHYCKRYPIYTMDVANACWQLAQHALVTSKFHGTWHYCTPEPLTKYQILMQIAKLLNKESAHIKPILKPMDNTPRPYDCALDCSSLFQLGVKPPKPFAQGIVEALNKHPY